MITKTDKLYFIRGTAHPEEEQEWYNENGDTWRVNNSSFDEYCFSADFRGQGFNLAEILERQIGNNESNVGIDIAAGQNAAALQYLILTGVLNKGLATNLDDRRSPSAKDFPNLDHQDGDILQEQTWLKFDAWVSQNAPDGLALVMHRPYAALQDLPARFYRGAAHYLLDRIRPGGILFTQVPHGLTYSSHRLYLEAVNRSIKRRPDVDSIVVTPGIELSGQQHPADGLDYAVIIKSS